MGEIASLITSLTIVYSGTDQSKHQSSASLAFVWGIHRGPMNSPQKWPVTRKMFPFDDVIMSHDLFTRILQDCFTGTGSSEITLMDMGKNNQYHSANYAHIISLGCTGAHFTNDFSIVIQIQWKFYSAVIKAINWLLWILPVTWLLRCCGMCKILLWYLTYNGVTVKPILHWSWIVEEKSWYRNENIVLFFCFFTGWTGGCQNDTELAVQQVMKILSKLRHSCFSAMCESLCIEWCIWFHCSGLTYSSNYFRLIIDHILNFHLTLYSDRLGKTTVM